MASIIVQQYQQKHQRLYYVALTALTLFISAFLLFWVELFSAKLVLPQLGGSPAVWTTCLLFFQCLLLLGYGLANWLSRIPLRYQISVQFALLVSGLICLPIALKLHADAFPNSPAAIVVLILLLSSIGLPFLALAGLSPLLQHWFERMEYDVSPYIFYGASNLGSLVSLILYPLWIESHFKLSFQGQVWSILYGLVMGLVLLCGMNAWNSSSSILHLQHSSPSSCEPPSRKQCRSWVVLSFTVSSLLSGTTTFTSVKVAPFPLLWAFFLGLYLLSMILVFAPKPQYIPNSLLALICPIVAVGLIAEFLPEESNVLLTLVKLHVVWIGFFLIAWACHGRLAQTKPAPAYLTQFYLWIALGGALGGAFNALIVPIVFKTGREYEVVLMLSLILLPKVKGRIWNLVSWSGLIGLACAATLLTNGIYPFNDHSSAIVASDRSFFGSYVITDDTAKKIRYLCHGITLHGVQFLDPQLSNTPLSYYSRSGPLGDVFRNFKTPASHVGVIGLGSGTIAAYAEPGDQWKFYEIDPLIIKFAQTYFTFLQDAKAPVEFQSGDGRIELAKSTDRYDLLIVDAFTSDAIPQHLLTQEAVELYLAHLKPNGVIAFHISNHYLDLAPILGQIASSLNIDGLIRSDWRTDEGKMEMAITSSRWVVLSHKDRLNHLTQQGWKPLPFGSVLWSDDFSSLISALHIRTEL